jgi:hypothetical protein
MAKPKCWICGDPATTGEHLIKKTDLAEIFGKPKPKNPLFLHNATKTNHIVQGLNANALKLASRLCANCNNQRSQPYDRAWERFSHTVRNRFPPVVPGDFVRADHIYALGSNRELRNVQLYFVKLFGCLIHEHKIPIDLQSFAKALLEGKFHRDVFIRLGCIPCGHRVVGVAGLSMATDRKTSKVSCAQWFYELGCFAVNVIYTPDHDFWDLTDGAWHPKHGTGRLLLHDFSSNIRN